MAAGPRGVYLMACHGVREAQSKARHGEAVQKLCISPRGVAIRAEPHNQAPPT